MYPPGGISLGTINCACPVVCPLLSTLSTGVSMKLLQAQDKDSVKFKESFESSVYVATTVWPMNMVLGTETERPADCEVTRTKTSKLL